MKYCAAPSHNSANDAEKQQGYGDSGGAGHVSAVERQKQNANAHCR